MMRWMPIRALLAALILLVLGAPRAEGQVCTFTVAEMSFGGESSLPTSQIDATSTITVTCQATIDPGDLRVCLSLPAGSGGNTVLDRRLVNMDRDIQYQLYTGPSRIVAWGEYQGAGTMVVVDFVGLSVGIPVTQIVTVYGRLMGGQSDLRAGLYQSTLNPTARWERGVLGTLPDCAGVSENETTLPPLNVRFQLEPSCTVAVNPLDFGNVTDLTAGRAATTNLAVTCTLGTPYNVALDGGTVTGDPLDRKMQRVGGTATIGYQLFQDHTRTQPWGNTPGSVLEGIGSGAVQSISIHGWIPAHSVTAIGTYQDLVTVTVEY